MYPLTGVKFKTIDGGEIVTQLVCIALYKDHARYPDEAKMQWVYVEGTMVQVSREVMDALDEAFLRDLRGGFERKSVDQPAPPVITFKDHNHKWIVMVLPDIRSRK